MIQVRDIAFSYDHRDVVRDISLCVSAGDVLVIMGANGSGKTTLLRLMAGLLSPARGAIDVCGHPISALSDRNRALHIGLVPQETTSTFPFRVLEFVLMGRIPHRGGLGFSSGEDLAIAEEALRSCDAWQFRNRRITELSGGEKTRAVLARALAQQPKVLLLDEPTAFLDIRHQVDILKRLVEWRSQTGGAVVTVLHDLNLAAQFCSRCALLKEGRLVAIGATAEILNYSNVCTTFETDVYVGINELTGRPFFVPR
jgi:iron complex transport system ATP-binding protein